MPDIDISYPYKSTVPIAQTIKDILAKEISDITKEELRCIETDVKKVMAFDHSLVPFDIVFIERGGIPKKTTSGKFKRNLCKYLNFKDALPK